MTKRADNAAPHGWLVIDKPAGITSARVVAAVKRATGAKVGHAGTLDPLATGVLPLALGEATKTAQFADRRTQALPLPRPLGRGDRYRRPRGRDRRRERGAAGRRCGASRRCRRFTGTIWQRPPAYSAIKIGGRRAYALARAGEAPELAARPVEIAELRAARHARSRPRRFRGLGRRGHLYPLPGPRPRRGARHARPYRRTAPASRSGASPRRRRFRWNWPWRSGIVSPLPSISCRSRRRWTTSRRSP